MSPKEYNDALYLAHHGVKGQKWGTRRYQNEDGSYKSGAEGRYDPDTGARRKPTRKEYKSEYKAAKKEYKADKKAERNAKIKKAVGYGLAGAAIAGVAAYGLSKAMKSGAARIAAADGMKVYKDLIDQGVIKLGQGVSADAAVKNRGKAVYDQITNGGVTTKQASREVLKYLGTGASMKSLPSADSLGRVQSTGELAAKAALAQTKRVGQAAGSALKDAGGSIKNKVTEARNNFYKGDPSTYSDLLKKKANSIAKSMNHDAFDEAYYLAHHGVKGQKWGVRRYQNEDGSYTDLGAKRRRDGDKSGGISTENLKKAAKIGAAVAGAALLTYGAYKLHSSGAFPSSYRSSPVEDWTLYGLTKKPLTEKFSYKAKNAIKSMPGKIADKIRDKAPDLKKKLQEGSKKALEETGEFAKKSVKKAGEAAASAALASIGTITAAKLADRYKDREGDDEQTRNANLIKREMSTAAARSITNSASVKVSGNKSSTVSNGGGFTRERLNALIAEVGEPHQVHAWSDPDVNRRWSNLLNRYRDRKDVVEEIRNMKRTAFDIDQIEKKYG